MINLHSLLENIKWFYNGQVDKITITQTQGHTELIWMIDKLCSHLFSGRREFGEREFLEFETKMAYCPICHEFILRHKRQIVEMCSWRAALPYNSCNFTETASNMWNVIEWYFFEFCSCKAGGTRILWASSKDNFFAPVPLHISIVSQAVAGRQDQRCPHHLWN